MRAETSIMTLDQKLRKVYSGVFFRKHSQGYQKPFAEACAEGYMEGYKVGLTEAILSWKGDIEASALAELIKISEEDILRIWEQP